MIKHIPSTIIVLAEAGKVVIIRINGLVRIITTIDGLASQRSPGLPNGLVNESPRQHSIFVIIKWNSKAIHSALALQLVAIFYNFMCMRTVCHMTCTWQQPLSTSFTREC